MFFIKHLTMFLFMLWLNHVKANLVTPLSMEDSLKQCLATNPKNGLGYCFGVSTITKLQNLDSSPEFDLIDGVSLPKDATQEYRDINYDYAVQDPSDFRSIVDTFDHVFAKRAMRLDMGFFYPGLTMQVTPSFSPGGVMEFVLNPSRETFNVHRVKETSTGRVLARSILLPFLLGMKFNISTLVPIMFGILVLVIKKAVVVGKIALVLSSAFGLAALLFNNNNNFGGGSVYQGYPSQNYYHAGEFHPTTFTGHYNKYKEEYPEILYRGIKENPDAFVDENQQTYQVHQEADKRRGRNFAWNDDEKENKSAI